MDDIPLSVLFTALTVLILLSGFFSSSETGMMALNRYRLRNLVEKKHRGAILASKLLEHPDKLIGLILFGNNVVNFLAASLGAAIAVRLMGNLGYAIAPFVLTFIFLIFAETAPKTYAAIRPERIAFPASYVLIPLQKIFYPFVFIINYFSNGLIRVFGINPQEKEDSPLTREELRTVVREAGAMIPRRHQRMLISILDLEKETVDDIMVPRNELVGINLEDPPNEIIDDLVRSQHTRLILYRGNLDDIVGMLHARHVLRIFRENVQFLPGDLINIATEPYYVPESTPLHTQLMNFQRLKKRIGLVVDEYGVIVGMVTLEDILEEIVGEFTTDMQTFNLDIHPQEDGSYIIDGSATIRDINRQLHWKLPTYGTKTLNGLILEHLEDIPESGTSLRIDNYTVEITQAADNAVKRARINLIPDTANREAGNKP